MGTHEAAEFRAVMIGAHEELALILVAAWIARSRLSSCSQALEVEFVGVALSVNFCHDVFVVVIPVISFVLLVIVTIFIFL